MRFWIRIFHILLLSSFCLGENHQKDEFSAASSSLRRFLSGVAKNATFPQPQYGITEPIDPLPAIAPLRYLHEGDLLKLRLLLTNVTLIGLSSLTVQEVTLTKRETKKLTSPLSTIGTEELPFASINPTRPHYDILPEISDSDSTGIDEDEYDYHDAYDIHTNDENVDDEDYMDAMTREGSGYRMTFQDESLDEPLDDYGIVKTAPGTSFELDNLNSFEKLFLKDYENFVKNSKHDRQKRSSRRSKRRRPHRHHFHEPSFAENSETYKTLHGNTKEDQQDKKNSIPTNFDQQIKRAIQFFGANIRVSFANLQIKAQYVVKGRAGGVFTFKEQGRLVLSIPSVFLTSTFNGTIVQDLTGLRHLKSPSRRNHVKVQKVRSRMSIETPKLELIPVSRPAEWVRRQLQEKMDELGKGVGRRDGAVRLLLRHWAKLLRRLVSKSLE